MRRRAFPICLLLCFLALSRSAAADDACPKTGDRHRKDVTVDLAAGAPAATFSFGLRDVACIHFKNRNPFLRYSISVKGAEQEEGALTAFTKLFSIAGLAAPAVTPTPPAMQPVQPSPAPAAPSPSGRSAAKAQAQEAKRAHDVCWNAVKDASDLLEEARGHFVELNRSAGELNARFMALNTAVSASQDVFDSRTVTEDEIKAASNALQNAVSNAGLDQPWADYTKAYNDLFAVRADNTTLLGRIDKKMLEADTECDQKEPAARERLAAMRERRSTLFSDTNVQKISTDRDTLNATIQKIKAQAAQVATIVNDPKNFSFDRTAGPFGSPTIVTITATTKLASDKAFPTSPDFSFVINFGGPPRFSMSVGIAGTRLETREYSAVQGVPLNADGSHMSEMLTSVVGLKDSSGQRITPMLLLNTRLWQEVGIISGIHFSLGLSGKVDNLGTDVEYLTGFSFGFAENRALLTLGAYNGRVQTLQPGFYVGRALGNVAQPSVRKDRHWKPMIAISYKIL